MTTTFSAALFWICRPKEAPSKAANGGSSPFKPVVESEIEALEAQIPAAGMDSSGFAPCCRPAHNDDWAHMYERHTGANRDYLVKVGKDGLFFPATHLDFCNAIVSEAPRRQDEDEDPSEAGKLFYQMAIEQGSSFLISVADVYACGSRNRDNFDFLEVGEQWEVGGYQLHCVAEPPVDFYPTFSALEIKLFKGEQEVRTLWQYIPNGQPAAYDDVGSFLNICDMMASEIERRQIPVDANHPMIVNCNTGKDRSMTLTLIWELTRKMLACESKEDIPWDNMALQLKMAARMAEVRSTRGAAWTAVGSVIRQNGDLAERLRGWLSGRKVG